MTNSPTPSQIYPKPLLPRFNLQTHKTKTNRNTKNIKKTLKITK